MLDTPRTRRRTTNRPALVAAWLALICVPVRGDEAESYRRLEAMPHERRAALAENLAAFDRLDAGEKAAIRRLDRELSRRDQIDQARFLALIRRYHLWLNGLTEAQRQSLRSADSPEARLALARQIRQKSASDVADSPRLSGIRIGELGLIGPYEMADLLRAWNTLTPERRKDLAALRGGKLLAALRAEAERAKVAPLPKPPDLGRIDKARIEADPTLKALVGTPDRPAEGPDASVAATPKRPPHPYAEFLYFEEPEHRPRPVATDHLLRFQASCPPGFLAMTDPLTPDDARAYLTILYRLLYPFPAEMPAPAGPGTAKPAPRPGPAPRNATPVPL